MTFYFFEDLTCQTLTIEGIEHCSRAGVSNRTLQQGWCQ